ncbi:hypothetical protein I551_0681 [Mycobacterium ulcerans str. Harvey]|uniref:Uncharacterized protein n=1 Tax=Mycobacterium ulcerans str. Harvey TaxID=1299332 RepID=A0ABN0R6Q4_MYCUL|nr:hypothetical protein I551_0681 [Mycobacterium ulcerans str. Harvey]
MWTIMSCWATDPPTHPLCYKTNPLRLCRDNGHRSVASCPGPPRSRGGHGASGEIIRLIVATRRSSRSAGISMS